VINLRKPAMGAFVGLIVAVAAACGSSAATPTPAAPGGSVAPGASVAATANANDASALITQALSGSSQVKSFHIKVTAAGTIKAAALADATSGAAAGSDIKLDGTSLEGDVDIANSAAHLSVNVPAIASFGGVPITGDLILVDNALYYKISLLGGAKYSMVDLKSLSSSLSGLASGLPVAVPTPGASAMAGVTDQIAQIRQQLDAAGAKTTVVGTEQIGGQDAIHINITVPVDYINQQLTAAQADASPDPAMAGAKLDSATFDVWIYKTNNQLAQIHLTAASSAIGNIDFMLTLTNYDKPVTIAAPAAGDISSAPPLFP
jgi:hypothetical protein